MSGQPGVSAEQRQTCTQVCLHPSLLSPGGSSQPVQMKEQCEREHGERDFKLSHIS